MRIRLSTITYLKFKCKHTIGYLKGRFQSFKELRVQIQNLKDLALATAWINVCIILHAFCMDQKLNIHEVWLRNRQKFQQSLRTRSSPIHDIDQSRETVLKEVKRARKDFKDSLLKLLE